MILVEPYFQTLRILLTEHKKGNEKTHTNPIFVLKVLK